MDTHARHDPFLPSVGRFARHVLEMCMAMCAGAVVLTVAFFASAASLGYPDLLGDAPELSTLVLAINLTVPMLVWMRFRKHAWQSTLEMAGATMALGIVLVAAMLFRFDLYAGRMSHRHGDV